MNLWNFSVATFLLKQKKKRGSRAGSGKCDPASMYTLDPNPCGPGKQWHFRGDINEQSSSSTVRLEIMIMIPIAGQAMDDEIAIVQP